MPAFSPALPATGIIDGVAGLSTDGILYGEAPTAVTGIDISTVPDDGGIKVTATGTWPLSTGDRVKVEVIDTGSGLTRLCYSGIIGNAEFAESKDAVNLPFVVPPMPIGGPYNLRFTEEVGGAVVTLAAAITYIHRTYVTSLFRLRSIAGRPRFVGPYSIEDED